MPICRSITLALTLLALLPAQARAQDLARMVKHLFDVATINSPVGTVDHTSHFFLGDEALNQLPRQLNVALAAQLASFPLASSSGGFTFGLNPRGEVVPTSRTFGPSFAERAVTIGKRKVNFGFTYQQTGYSKFEGIDLENGDLKFVSEHNNCCPATANAPGQPTDFNPAFERDLLSRRLTANIDTKTTAFFANFGVTDRFDVGAAVPIVKVKMDARIDGEILRTSGETVHVFDATGATTKSFADSGSATGLGDILLRAKYNVYRTETTAFAGALDLRLPTGDEDNLLGTGATQAQVFFIGSGEYGLFSPHVNFGYTFSHGETSPLTASVGSDEVDEFRIPTAANPNPDPIDRNVPDEVNYTFGFNVAAGSKVTFGFDVRGRTLRDVPRFDRASETFLNRGPGAVLPTASFTADDAVAIAADRGNLNLLLGVVGGKVNLGGTFLLNITVLFPMSDAGLKPKPTPVIGFDYVF
jgi:hypothetical protein